MKPYGPHPIVVYAAVGGGLLHAAHTGPGQSQTTLSEVFHLDGLVRVLAFNTSESEQQPTALPVSVRLSGGRLKSQNKYRK